MKNYATVPIKSRFQALPSYPGGKRRLVSWIFGQLEEIIKPFYWSDLTLVDAFVGGGAISMYAKAQGFSLKCNDWSNRSQIVLEALIANNWGKLGEHFFYGVLEKLSESDVGFIEQDYGGSVFSLRHARVLDLVRLAIEEMGCSITKAMAKLLLWHLTLEFIAFSTSVGTSNKPFAQILDSKMDWWALNPKRYQDGSFKKLLEPCFEVIEKKRKAINSGVFQGISKVECFRQDAFDFVKSVEGHILYLDPPYPGTMGYERENRVLDSIILDEKPATRPEISPFTKSVDALSDLLVRSQHIPMWIISYGNKVVDLTELKAVVCEVAPNRKVQAWQKPYQHMAHVSQNGSSEELLVIAYSKDCPYAHKEV